MKSGIYLDLFRARLRLARARRDGDPAEIVKAEEYVDQLLETIFERQAEL